MNHKTIAVAVTLTAGIGLAVQDFGVPPGIPYDFVEGEVAVADEVNANFQWIEDALDTLALIDTSLDERIDDVEDDSKQRTQSLAALGYFATGSPLPLPNEEEGGAGFAAERGFGDPGWLGWLNIPVPQDWDPTTTMTVSVNMLNYVDSLSGQTGQDIEIDIFGDLIYDSDPIYDFDDGPLCAPGPVCGSDFVSNCFITVPEIVPEILAPSSAPARGGPGSPPGDPYMVNATFSIEPFPLARGISTPRQIRVNIYEPVNPLIAPGKMGGSDPVVFLLGPADIDPAIPPCFVSLEYTAH